MGDVREIVAKIEKQRFDETMNKIVASVEEPDWDDLFPVEKISAFEHAMRNVTTLFAEPSWDELFPTGAVATVEMTTDAFQLYLAAQMGVNNANKIQEEHLQRLIAFYPELATELGLMPEVFADLEFNLSKYNEQLKINKVAISEVSEITPKYTEFQHQLSATLGLLPEEIKNITTNAQTGARAVGAVAQAMIAMAGGDKDRIIKGLKLAKLAAVADSIAGASKSFAQGGFAGFAGGIAMLATMMTRIASIDQQISEANSMEQGGLIGGRRHSQGGTMINAERGEFVMSRNAVNAIGVENLNNMNQGSSGGGGTTIVINNPIVNSDFVENDFSELMREAVRKGADFGIS